jgi:hypothetical protein
LIYWSKIELFQAPPDILRLHSQFYGFPRMSEPSPAGNGLEKMQNEPYILRSRSEIEEGSPNIKGAAYFFGMNL